jgi:hypothetical protein
MRSITPFIAAVLLAVLLVAGLDLHTGHLGTQWDTVYYMSIATDGLRGNDQLAAPFAYRPGMPLLARATADLGNVSVERGFEVVGHIAAVGLLVLAFGLARAYTAHTGRALTVMAIIGLSYYHIRYPLFYPTMVDVAAYPLMIAAIWALLKGRFWWCVGLACIGVFFKEFLVIPAALLILSLVRTYRRTPSPRVLGQIVIAGGLVGACVLLPRLFIPVYGTVQHIDPLNNPKSLLMIVVTPLYIQRDFNVLYALLAYWLPVLILLTPLRWRRLRDDLAEQRWVLTGYVGLVEVLTLYGGTNIPIFTSYALAAQIVILAVLLRYEVAAWEIALVFAAVLIFNRVPWTIPQPGVELHTPAHNAHLDFYGGWSGRLSLSSLIHLLEITGYLTLAYVLRVQQHLGRFARLKTSVPNR